MFRFNLDRAKLDDIIALTSSILEPDGFEVIEAEWFGSDRILRLYIDVAGGASPQEGVGRGDLPPSDGTGIDLDGCVIASRRLMDVEELDELVEGTYHLEVSSPGLERPLRKREHFEKVLGETVDVKLTEPSAERRAGKGRLLEVTTDSSGVTAAEGDVMITIETSRGPWSFPLASLKKAHLVYAWEK